MPAWKVLLIGLFTVTCFVFAMSTLLAPMIHAGNDRWAWMGGSLAATAAMIWVTSILLRHASRALDVKPARGRS